MRALTFSLRLLEPMLATSLEGDPNSAVSFDYAPGSVIRGAVISLYLRKRNRKELDLQNQEALDLFFNGKVRYLNAYPLAVINSNGETARALPTPLSWHIRKDGSVASDSTTVYDFRFASAQQDFKQNHGEESRTPLANAQPFFRFETSQKFIAAKPSRRIAVHTQREAVKGRAIEDGGAVFRYDSVETGTQLGGVIIFEDSASNYVNGIKDLLTGAELNLGRSRTGGYGRAIVTSVPQDQAWVESAIPTKIEVGSEFSITLLANALVRDANGQLQTDLLPAELKDSLGVVESVSKGTHKRAEAVGGFNRKWGLPLPQTVSIKAGSVFVFKAAVEITQNQLQKLVDRGIGERRCEGFGRLAVNLNVNPQIAWRGAYEDKPASAPDLAAASNDEIELLRRIAKGVLRQRFDVKLPKLVNSYKIVSDSLRNHQISRLRAVIRAALRSKNPHLVTDFFKNLRPTGQQAFESAKVEAQSLSKWIEQTIRDLSLFEVKEVAFGASDEAMKAEIKLEYHLRLIDGMLAQAAKEAK